MPWPGAKALNKSVTNSKAHLMSGRDGKNKKPVTKGKSNSKPKAGHKKLAARSKKAAAGKKKKTASKAKSGKTKKKTVGHKK